MGSLNKRRDDFYHIVCIFSGFLWYLILARDFFIISPLFYGNLGEVSPYFRRPTSRGLKKG